MDGCWNIDEAQKIDPRYSLAIWLCPFHPQKTHDSLNSAWHLTTTLGKARQPYCGHVLDDHLEIYCPSHILTPYWLTWLTQDCFFAPFWNVAAMNNSRTDGWFSTSIVVDSGNGKTRRFETSRNAAISCRYISTGFEIRLSRRYWQVGR